MEGGVSGMDAVVTGLTTGLKDIADSAMGAIGTVVPYALPILGAMIVIGIAIGVIHKVTHK